jgi:hypothetical protein
VLPCGFSVITALIVIFSADRHLQRDHSVADGVARLFLSPGDRGRRCVAVHAVADCSRYASLQVPLLLQDAVRRGAATTELSLVLNLSREAQHAAAVAVISSRWRGALTRTAATARHFARRPLVAKAAAQARWRAALAAVQSRQKVRHHHLCLGLIRAAACCNEADGAAAVEHACQLALLLLQMSALMRVTACLWQRRFEAVAANVQALRALMDADGA